MNKILKNLDLSKTYQSNSNLHRRPLALDDEEPEGTDNSPNHDSNVWHPYNSKLMFLLDTIDNLPRLCISGFLMKVLLWLLQHIGVKHVPSFDALREVQHKVQKESGVPTINWMSPKGNAFLFNDPRMLIANVSFPLLKGYMSH